MQIGEHLLDMNYPTINHTIIQNDYMVDNFRCYNNRCDNIIVESIIELFEKANTVYCVTTLDDSHQAVFNGLLTHNCGEIVMYQNECCNLGSICLSKFCKKSIFNYEELARVTRIATRFLNANIDRLDVPDQELITFVKLLRRLGLGIMGLADCFAKLGIVYGSEESFPVLGEILTTMQRASYDESHQLIRKYGSVYSRLVDAGYDVSNISGENSSILKSRANIATMCIAPTGSTSLIHGMSSGIEPYFALEYYQLGRLVYNKYLLKKYPISVLPIASEISPSAHLAIQAEAQKYVDNSISKTINCNYDVPIAEVINCIIIAHNKGIKGTTIYRDNCRNDQPLRNCNTVDGSCDL
jgi:ribonucleoside-diphosphate reductase alpha chain